MAFQILTVQGSFHPWLGVPPLQLYWVFFYPFLLGRLISRLKNNDASYYVQNTLLNWYCNPFLEALKRHMIESVDRCSNYINLSHLCHSRDTSLHEFCVDINKLQACLL